jgi:hypothetical protein
MPASSRTPWYREPWPWLLMVAPAAAVVGGIVTVVLATRSADGLVVDDYYKQGLAVNQRLARAQNARALGITGTLSIEATTGGAVRANLRGNSLGAEAVVLTLGHPTRAGMDQRVTLTPAGEGVFVGRIAALAAGRWHVVVEGVNGRWRIRGELQIPQSLSAALSWGA